MVPVDVDDAVGRGRRPGRAVVVGPWTDTPRPRVTKADDLVTLHRRAAKGEPHHHVVEPLDVDADRAASGATVWAAAAP